MKRLESKTAFVSGGRQGIGRAIVDLFFVEGATVMTCGRGPRPADLDESILWHTMDVGNTYEVSALPERIAAELGELSVLVNNAGIQIEKTLIDTTDEDW
ncbi:MAG: SDR family NAD(P)-dependent oxidoreductase, partial [Acidiferrobacterales bacterium]|nr:SDR family NAD(P)-dependent oxidoreductase [Acidiferrobacterales bacterium]